MEGQRSAKPLETIWITRQNSWNDTTPSAQSRLCNRVAGGRHWQDGKNLRKAPTAFSQTLSPAGSNLERCKCSAHSLNHIPTSACVSRHVKSSQKIYMAIENAYSRHTIINVLKLVTCCFSGVLSFFALLL